MIKTIAARLRSYVTLTKSLQTGLLLVTGMAGYMSGRCPVRDLPAMAGLCASLFLAVGGSTVLNMVYDRNIDGAMARTCARPLPAGRIRPAEAAVAGLFMTAAGVAWAFAIGSAYGAVVLAGVLLDVIVYTAWLKRRTPWSIILGGVAGGMPVLAGRTLALGQLDTIGLLLALAVLLWIPTHIMTFSLRYREDYARAGVPTFPSAYGSRVTRLAIALSSVAAAICVAAACIAIGMTGGLLVLVGVLAFGLLALAAGSLIRPSERLNFGLFKYASAYMLGSMVLVVISTL